MHVKIVIFCALHCKYNAQFVHHVTIYSTYDRICTGPLSAVRNFLATVVSLTADPGVMSLILAWSHTFVEIDHEIISTVILLPSAESFKKDCCQLQAKVCAQSTGFNCLFKLAQEKVWFGQMTVPP